MLVPSSHYIHSYSHTFLIACEEKKIIILSKLRTINVYIRVQEKKHKFHV